MARHLVVVPYEAYDHARTDQREQQPAHRGRKEESAAAAPGRSGAGGRGLLLGGRGRLAARRYRLALEQREEFVGGGVPVTTQAAVS
ncbi:hypothetical protein ABZV77_28540 [Streptomyces sp. NPDC004732]|uniref:hypothetical protein n=1 Tax=Streptomyces sp. NPDC004732 TaxID=3154290 RepID=UPI0033AE57FA